MTKPTTLPLYVTVEYKGGIAIITARGPQYVTNSRTVYEADVSATIAQMRSSLTGRTLIVKEFAE
jgi:hypothetical protein